MAGRRDAGRLEYRSKANLICRDTQALADDVAKPHHDHDVPEYMASLRAIAREGQERLWQVPRPPQDDLELRRNYLEPIRSQLARAPKVHAEVARARTPEEKQRAEGAARALAAEAAKATGFAKAYGLTDCAQPGRE